MGRIIASSTFSLQRTIFPRNGLTAFWNLEDASSSTPIPAQFGNFSLTRFGTAYTSIAGKIGKGFEFANASQGSWTNQQLWNLLTNPTSFSVSFWHKIPDNTQPPFSVMGNAFGSMGFHFDYYNFGHGYDGSSDLNWVPGSYGISFRMSGPGGPYKWNAVFANEATPNNTWTLVTATYDLPTTTMKLYLNGVLKSTYSNAVIGSNSEPSWHGFALNGTVVNDGKVYGVNQCFDALGFWSRALDQSEVSNLYNNGNGIQFNLLNSISIKKQNLGGGKMITSLRNYFTCPFEIDTVTCPTLGGLSEPGWYLAGNTVRIGKTIAPDGSNSAVEYKSSGTQGSFVSQGFQEYWRPNKTYIFSIWAKTTLGTAVNGEILNITRNDAEDRIFLPALGNLTSTWQKFTLSFTTGSSYSGDYITAFFCADITPDVQFALWGAEMNIIN